MIQKLDTNFSLDKITEFTKKDELRLRELRELPDSDLSLHPELKDELDSLIFKQKANIEKGLIDDGKYPELDFQHNISARQSWAIYLLEKENYEKKLTEKRNRNGQPAPVIVFS